MDIEKSTPKNKRGGAREGAGRPAFVPTAAEREQVAAMSAYGVPQIQVAATIRGGVDVNTLRKYFADELVTGKASANEAIGKRLYEKAMDGDTTALIWWTKTQMAWSERTQIDHTSSDGSMTPVKWVVIDPAKDGEGA